MQSYTDTWIHMCVYISLFSSCIIHLINLYWLNIDYSYPLEYTSIPFKNVTAPLAGPQPVMLPDRVTRKMGTVRRTVHFQTEGDRTSSPPINLERIFFHQLQLSFSEKLAQVSDGIKEDIFFYYVAPMRFKTYTFIKSF